MSENKNKLLMDKINLFFENDINKKVLINILNNNFNISLRIIDWFVTNYCKKYNIFWIENNQRFVVYVNYKLQLKDIQKNILILFVEEKEYSFIIKMKNI